jgi:hypothetical protein
MFQKAIDGGQICGKIKKSSKSLAGKLRDNKPKETQMSDKLKIKADVYWAQLTRKNEMSDAYQVTLCNLSDKAVAALEDMGISVLSNDSKPEQGKYISCKSQKPIKAFDSDGVEIIEDIGNGSKAVCMISAYSWTYKNKKGVSPSLVKLVVTDLVEYASGGNVSADDEDVL